MILIFVAFAFGRYLSFNRISNYQDCVTPITYIWIGNNSIPERYAKILYRPDTQLIGEAHL